MTSERQDPLPPPVSRTHCKYEYNPITGEFKLIEQCWDGSVPPNDVERCPRPPIIAKDAKPKRYRACFEPNGEAMLVTRRFKTPLGPGRLEYTVGFMTNTINLDQFFATSQPMMSLGPISLNCEANTPTHPQGAVVITLQCTHTKLLADCPQPIDPDEDP